MKNTYHETLTPSTGYVNSTLRAKFLYIF